MSQTSHETESLIENLLQACVDYERCERFDAKHRRLDLEEAKQAIRNAITADHAQTGQQQTGGDFYLVPREIIDQFPEINVNNYDHDDACALNAWGCEVVTNANPAFGPSDTSTDGESTPRVPKVRTSHHRNKEEAARLQAIVDERCK